MAFNFNFRTVEGTKDLGLLVDFMIKQDLKYPHYEDWVQRSEHEIRQGFKTAILVYSEGILAGDLIYQPHKQLPRVRELKNMRIHPALRGRYFAHFMLRQAEVENKEDYDAIICDARSDQHEMINLMRLLGYLPLIVVPLYDKNATDVVMVKAFDETSGSGILYHLRQFALAQSV